VHIRKGAIIFLLYRFLLPTNAVAEEDSCAKCRDEAINGGAAMACVEEAEETAGYAACLAATTARALDCVCPDPRFVKTCTETATRQQGPKMDACRVQFSANPTGCLDAVRSELPAKVNECVKDKEFQARLDATTSEAEVRARARETSLERRRADADARVSAAADLARQGLQQVGEGNAQNVLNASGTLAGSLTTPSAPRGVAPNTARRDGARPPAQRNVAPPQGTTSPPRGAPTGPNCRPHEIACSGADCGPDPVCPY
jgi:hypothetical protein